MLDARADFPIENVNLELQKVHHNDRITLCVIHKSCSLGYCLDKGFDFTRKIFI